MAMKMKITIFSQTEGYDQYFFKGQLQLYSHYFINCPCHFGIFDLKKPQSTPSHFNYYLLFLIHSFAFFFLFLIFLSLKRDKIRQIHLIANNWFGGNAQPSILGVSCTS